MTLHIYNRYGVRSTSPSGAYPGGSFKNESVQGAKDGTPVEKDWADNLEGDGQALLLSANFWASGQPDQATYSQKQQARLFLFASNTRPMNSFQYPLCAGIPINAWHDPSAPLNIGSLGLEVRDSCMGWSSPYDRPEIFFVCGDNNMYYCSDVWDYQGSINVAGPLALSYSETPDALISICCDYQYFYIVYRAQITKVLRVAKFANIEFTGNYLWDISLGETMAADDNLEYVKAIVANNDAIAVSLPAPVDGVNINGVALVGKVSGVLLKGTGNNTSYSTPSDLPQYGKIVSDTYHIFWLGRIPTTPNTFVLASAYINDPTISAYSLQTVAEVASSDEHKHVKGLVNLGKEDGVVLTHDSEGRIRQFDKGRDATHGVVQIGNFSEYPHTLNGGYDVMSGFDGLNVWLHTVGHDLANNEPGVVMHKVPSGYFGPRRGNSGVDVFQTIYPNQVSMNWSGLQVDGNPAGRVLFDGRDLWTVWRNGTFHRICNTIGR